MLRLKSGLHALPILLLMMLIAGCPAPTQNQTTASTADAPAAPAPATADSPVAPVSVPAPAPRPDTAATAPAVGRQAAAPMNSAAPATTATTAVAAVPPPAAPARLPKMVDLGRNSCIPCKMMAPILEQLKAELAGRAEIVVIDISEDPIAAQRYRLRAIPTQIFYDREGNEVGRHEGFLPKEEIIAQLRQLGMQ